jgi:hypothetical protein
VSIRKAAMWSSSLDASPDKSVQHPSSSSLTVQ